MTRRKYRERIAKLVTCAEAFFGEKVMKTSAPGGEGRASWRFEMESRPVIVTMRPNFRRTHIEAMALRKIGQFNSDIPQCLGVVGEVMFQSDVGARRLNQEIALIAPDQRLDMAQEAVAAIFRIQAAARQAGLNETMPHLGVNREWISNFTEAIISLEPFSAGRCASVDKIALAEAIARPATQFVKWDCRSGNAAIGEDDRLRWFDFEYSGVRHGAEDLAWLLGDEAWPIAPDAMEQIIIANFDAACGHDLEGYLDYLAVYVTLHCVQRLKLIVKEAHKRGWLSKARVRKYDDAGVHPEFAAQICRVGAYFGARMPLTVPLARDFEDAQKVFEEVLRKGSTTAQKARVAA
ncbi:MULTISPECIES: hypothetical protein [unclassified Marinovum]